MIEPPAASNVPNVDTIEAKVEPTATKAAIADGKEEVIVGEEEIAQEKEEIVETKASSIEEESSFVGAG